jgi:imidazolonepropionase-like amidohydrolase
LIIHCHFAEKRMPMRISSFTASGCILILLLLVGFSQVGLAQDGKQKKQSTASARSAKTKASQANPGRKAKDKAKKSIQTIALTNVTVHAMNGADPMVGTIVIRDGRIAAIGDDVEVPSEARQFDLAGFHATPGLIESRGRLWMTTNANSETNTKAELNVVDAIDPWSEDWQELASQGITSVYVQPTSASFVGGYGAVLRVRRHGDLQPIILRENVAVQVAIGTKGNTSKDRFAQVTALEKLIESAKDKKEDSAKAGEKKENAGKDADKKSDSKEGKSDAEKEGSDSQADEDAENKKKDVTKEIFGRVLKREIPLFIEVHHSDALKRILKLVDKYDLRVVLDGLSKVDSCRQTLVDAGLPMVVGPLQELTTVPAYRKDSKFDWLVEASQSDPLWSLATFAPSARLSRMLRMQTAAAIRAGVEHDSVMAAVTSNPARILGIADEVGTLEVGKQADIAVFAGDPLDPSTPVRLVMSHGEVIFEQMIEPGDWQDRDGTITKLPEKLPPNYVVKSSRVLVDGALKPAAIVVRSGVLSDVLADFKAEDQDGSMPVFDVEDAVITPGLVVASSTLGQANALNDSAESDASHLRAIDGVDPTVDVAQKMIASGFIHVGVAPSQQNTASGVVGHIRLGTGDYVVKPEVASQFVISESARNDDRFPASLNGQLQMIENLLQGQLPPSRVYVTQAIARSIEKEKAANLKAIADGKRKAVIVANSALEIRRALELADENRMRLVLYTSGRVGRFAKRMADKNYGLILPAFTGTEFDATLAEFVKACKAGVKLGFAGESADAIRMSAAMLISAGAPQEKVLAAMTSHGAGVIGMGETELKKNASADFVVWTDVPTNLSAKPINVVVDGKNCSTK